MRIFCILKLPRFLVNPRMQSLGTWMSMLGFPFSHFLGRRCPLVVVGQLCTRILQNWCENSYQDERNEWADNEPAGHGMEERADDFPRRGPNQRSDFLHAQGEGRASRKHFPDSHEGNEHGQREGCCDQV
mmetsp:Transcript_11044/g.68092  ORF Transcript_11044/g.68092 Transcript_11044/m.68092 type:complete len:130 (+) Transcript_11044:1528-1917(+)